MGFPKSWGYRQSSSIFFDGIFRYKPSGYESSPILGNHHIIFHVQHLQVGAGRTPIPPNGAAGSRKMTGRVLGLLALALTLPRKEDFLEFLLHFPTIFWFFLDL